MVKLICRCCAVNRCFWHIHKHNSLYFFVATTIALDFCLRSRKGSTFLRICAHGTIENTKQKIWKKIWIFNQVLLNIIWLDECGVNIENAYWDNTIYYSFSLSLFMRKCHVVVSFHKKTDMTANILSINRHTYYIDPTHSTSITIIKYRKR